MTQHIELLTIDEVAALLKTSRMGVHRARTHPKHPLKCVKFNGSVRIHPADLEAYLEKLRKAA